MRARVHVQIGFSDMREHSCQGGDMLELWTCFRPTGFTSRQELRTTAYPSFKYSLLKTSLPGTAFGARLRWGSGVDTFFSANTFLNSEVRLIDMLSLNEYKRRDKRVEWIKGQRARGCSTQANALYNEVRGGM